MIVISWNKARIIYIYIMLLSEVSWLKVKIQFLFGLCNCLPYNQDAYLWDALKVGEVMKGYHSIQQSLPYNFMLYPGVIHTHTPTHYKVRLLVQE